MKLVNNQIDRKKEPPQTKPKPKKVKDQQPVEVYCRIRPSKDEAALRARSETQVQVIVDCQANGQVFNFKKVFNPHSGQSVIFENVAFPLVESLVSGQNGLLFTYGVTSSGKTFTITGTPKCPGILPRTLDVLFNTLDKNDNQSMKYVFKPDGQNGFEVIDSPDAILRLQNEIQENNGGSTPYSTPLSTPFKKFRTPMRTLESTQNEWANREREQSFVNNINHDYKYAVFVSYVEIYNNYIYDLLDETLDAIVAKATPYRVQQTSKPMSKRLAEDIRKYQYVQGVLEFEVKSANEAYDLYLKGALRRRTGATCLNSESSRSHSVFTIRLVQGPVDLNGIEILNPKKYIHISQLSIVDLAGSERSGRTNASGTRHGEGCNINKSLMTLRNCFEALRENQKSHTKTSIVPYRESKLTHLFKNYFDGDGSVKMVICLNPGIQDFAENLDVLKFGEQSQEILTSKSRAPRVGQREFYDDQMFSGVSVGPPYPKRYLEDPEDEQILPEWISVLQQRKAEQLKTRQVFERMAAGIRRQIASVDSENAKLKQENSNQKMDLEAREAQLNDAENKMSHMKRDISALQRQNEQLTEQSSDLYHQLKVKESICITLQKELDQFRTKMSSHLEKEKERLKTWCTKMLEEKDMELRKMKCLNQDKLNLATQILMGDGQRDMFENFHLLSPTKPFNAQPSTSQQQTQVKTLAIQFEPQAGTSTFTPNGPPVVNPRFGAGPNAPNDKWLEHRPPGTIELGTVLQPHIKNSKSVTNLKPSDFIKNKNITKYAVTHNTATSSGVETEVFKGDVIPSVTGGAQIIFNDVETLKQGSPLAMGMVSSRKRNNEGNNTPLATENTGTSTGTATPTTATSTNHNK